jgi:DNA-binding response OmpR family regulator
MSAQTVRVLHVEDDVMQQRTIAHDLNALPEYAFAITAVTSEELAVECFQKGTFDLVLLDYQLAEGDGLHLLVRLRDADAIVPIIAISGMACSEVMAQLVQAGADDYFDKRKCTSGDLAKSIRSALRRAEAMRNKIANRTTDKLSRYTQQLTDLCVDYAGKMGAEFIEQVNVIVNDMRLNQISAAELQRLNKCVSSRLDVTNGPDQSWRQLLAKLLLLEVFGRVYDDPNLNEEQRD